MKRASVETVVKELNDAGVRYLVAGGLAVAAHGYLRLTADIDIVIALNEANAKLAMITLSELGYRPKVPVKSTDFADVEKRESWIRDKGMVVFQVVSDLHRDAPIDIFVREPFNFEEEYRKADFFELGRRTRIPVVRLEALIEMKKNAGRPKDLLDVAELEKIRKLKNDTVG